jgi:CrcB protein
MLGGYVIGAAIAFTAVAPEWRLFIVTGFCGGLTTFSTFSAEVATSIQAGQTLWSCAEIMAHVGGSLLMTFAGMSTVAWIRS